MDVTRYLDDLEARIDAAVEENLLDQWRRFTHGRCDSGIFQARRMASSVSRLDWPKVSVNAALDDFDAMMVQQLARCSDDLATGHGGLMCVRSNYGTSIIPSLFGAELFFMDEALNTLPTSWPMAGGVDTMRRLVDAGVPDLHQSLAGRTLEMGQRFVDAFAGYPKIQRYVSIYHPDLQGPMDICEVLWGSGLFLDVIDHPDVVKGMLGLLTDTYIAMTHAWRQIVPAEGDDAVHWQFMHKGQVVLRDDSAMNFSPAMFDEFIRPYDQRILATCGGGCIHFCGRGDHYIESATSMDGLYAIHLSQPDYNDMDAIYAATVDKGVKLLQFSRQTAEEALTGGRDLHGLVHCW